MLTSFFRFKFLFYWWESGLSSWVWKRSLLNKFFSLTLSCSSKLNFSLSSTRKPQNTSLLMDIGCTFIVSKANILVHYPSKISMLAFQWGIALLALMCVCACTFFLWYLVDLCCGIAVDLTFSLTNIKIICVPGTILNCWGSKWSWGEKNKGIILLLLFLLLRLFLLLLILLLLLISSSSSSRTPVRVDCVRGLAQDRMIHIFPMSYFVTFQWWVQSADTRDKISRNW